MKNKKMKTVFVIVMLIIIILCVKSIFTPSKKDESAAPPEATETATSETTSEEAIIEPKVEKETEPETEVVEHRTGDTIVGVSNKDIEDLDPLFFKSVNEDKTGNWRYATIASNEDIEYYVLSYYKKYFQADNEVHAIIDFTRKTTTRINSSGGVLTVSILDYVDGEEHDANLMFSGQLLKTYYIYTDNGDIEELN